MQSESTNASPNVHSQQISSNPSPTSQHGQQHDGDLQASRQPHSGELWAATAASDSLAGDDDRDATRAVAHSRVAGTTGRLRDAGDTTPPTRNRITEYENALANSPRKLSDGPLFDVIKSNKGPDDKSSPIANLPNGECHLYKLLLAIFLTSYRGLNSCHCPPLAKRPCCRLSRQPPLQ